MAKSFLHNAARVAALLMLGAGVAFGQTTKKPPAKPAAKPTVKTTPAKPAAVKKTEPPAPPPLAPGELPLAARAALSMDMATGDVLYEKNADALEYPASATKILTALLVIEAGDLDRLVTVQLADTKVEPSSLEIKVGETYPRKHLLYALLLKSANDAAIALARDHSGSVAAFAEKMSERAALLGAKESHFTNPHGLHNPHHFTTARDLALIARAAMQNQLFRDIVATPLAVLQKGGELVKLTNHNKLLTMMAGCTGIKTGYTVAAQQVLVSSAMRDGKEVLSVVLHTNKPGIWEDSKLLLNDGLDKLAALPGGLQGPPLPPKPLAALPPRPPVDLTMPKAVSADAAVLPAVPK